MELHLARLCLLLMLAPLVAFGQEPHGATDSIEPAVSSSEEFSDLEPSVGSDALAGMDSTEPATLDEKSRLAADVRRGSEGNRVMDEIDLGRTEITGNQELPKVLYIVPWQKSGPGELMGKPVNTLLDEVLAPIDRSEFVREVDYYDDLNGKDDE